MFCYHCGQALPDGANFCMKCGTKLTIPNNDSVSSDMDLFDPDDIDLDEEENEYPKTNFQMQQMLLKYFDDDSFGDALILSGRKEDIGSFLVFDDRIGYITDNELTYMIFNYMQEGLKQGFIITETRFIYFYDHIGMYSCKLCDIKKAISGRAGLAPVMVLVLEGNEMTDKIHLTGIRNAKEFVVRFNEFIYEFNHPGSMEDNMVVLESKDSDNIPDHSPNTIEALLSNACAPYVGNYTWCYINTPVSSTYDKYQAVVSNYGVKMPNEIYLIYDETVLSTCKKGFAVCIDGIYYKQSTTKGFIPWDEFKKLNIVPSFNSIRIGDLVFSSNKSECTIVVSILTKIQKNLI